MQRQVSLFTRKLAEVNSKFDRAEKPWTGVCCESCWNATGKKCVCKCNGRFHGRGRIQQDLSYCKECTRYDTCVLKPTHACSFKEVKK